MYRYSSDETPEPDYRQHFCVISYQGYGDYSPLNKGRELVIAEGEFKNVAADLIQNFDADDFRHLCKIAIRDGYISRQDLVTKIGDIIPRNVDKLADNIKWAVPSPTKTREILSLFSTLETSNATGSKLPWRHAQCAQPEAEPALPG